MLHREQTERREGKERWRPRVEGGNVAHRVRGGCGGWTVQVVWMAWEVLEGRRVHRERRQVVHRGRSQNERSAAATPYDDERLSHDVAGHSVGSMEREA